MQEELKPWEQDPKISVPSTSLEYDKQRKQSVNQERRVRNQSSMFIPAICERNDETRGSPRGP